MQIPYNASPTSSLGVEWELQLIDRETEAANELGDASHAKYKERQQIAVMRRLKLGGRG